MKKKTTAQNNAHMLEPGEENLAVLIKEAGAEARARKKKAMDYHAKKLRTAARGTLDSFSQDTAS